MRPLMPIVLAITLATAACMEIDTSGGDISHSEHRLSAAERASVEAGMAGYLKIPVTLSGLKTSYILANGNVAVCGYVSGVVNGKASPPALFGGTLPQGGGMFAPYRVPGQGQDPARIATVRAFCQGQQISI